MSEVTASHVADVGKAITSRSGVNRASKTRTTLATAQAILVASGEEYAARAMQTAIDTLSARIRDYYRGVGAAHLQTTRY